MQQHVKAWTCVGGSLITAPAPDSTAPTVKRVAPDSVSSVATAPSSAVAQSDAVPESVSAALPADEFCAYGLDECTRKISSYISETQYIAAYGGEEGVIGRFYFTIRTNLNGRQPIWTSSWTLTYGPTLDFYDASLQCIQNGNIFGCGSFTVGSGTFTDSNNISRVVRGSKLVQNGTYSAGVESEFGAGGYDYYFNQPPAYSATFTCKSTTSCRF